MAKYFNEKASRQEQRKEVLDKLLLVEESEKMKDFYDYIKDSINALDSLSGKDRVFFKWLKKKYQEKLAENGIEITRESQISVQEYINWGAHKLAEEMEDLDRWYSKETWVLPEKKESWPEIWKKTLKQWWEEDAIPTMSDRKIKCTPRDVILYVLMVMEFTVDESDEFLDELSLNKDSDKTRKLYTLDFKEGLFRWIMYWNENHPKKKISYKEACELYVKYGEKLLEYVKEELEKLPNTVNEWIRCARVDGERELRLFHAEAKEMCDILDDCGRIVNKLPGEAKMLYEAENAENLKRAFAVLVHAKRNIQYRQEKWENRRHMEKKSAEKLMQDIRHKNLNTNAQLGTQYAWKLLESLAGERQENFEEAFRNFMDSSVGFLSKAYWRQFSELMYLYGKSGGSSEEYEPYIKKVYFSAATDEPKIYKDAQLLDKEKGTVMSFAYYSDDITAALNSGTDNGTYLSSLMRPVPRNSRDMFSKGEVKSMPTLSALWNNYSAWCKGEKEPYVSYKRDKVLKLALACDVCELDKLSEAMSLAGSGNFNYLDPKEAMVYLIVRYREMLKDLLKKLGDEFAIVAKNDWKDPGAKNAFKRARNLVTMLPSEHLEELPVCLEAKDKFPTDEEKAVVQDALDWWNMTASEKRVPSVIEYIRKSDFLRIRFGASSETAGEIREKFFYGPYSGDFVKEEGKKRSGVSEEISWVQIECEIFRLMEAVLSEQGVRFAFELWHEGVLWSTFAGISPSSWHEACDLAEKRLEQIEKQMKMALEENGLSPESLRGDCTEVESYLYRLHEAAAQAGFMKQTPNALETEYLLEQWFYVLAAMRVLGIPTGDSIECLKEYVFHWVIIGGIKNFKYVNYRKERGFSSVKEMENDKMSDKHWRYQLENKKRIRERWNREFRFWERVYFDYKAICVSVDWMKDNHPESYSMYASKLKELRRKIKEDCVMDEIREKQFSNKNGNQPFSNMKSEWELVCKDGAHFLKLYDTKSEEYKLLKKRVDVLTQHCKSFYEDVERTYD